MPRRVRIEFEGAYYHIMCRGDRREAIFADEKDRETFLATLGETCERCGFVVHSYVLMDNHYHLLIETPSGNLVAGMKWFQGTYTARFNARHRLSGHLFAGRYKAMLVEGEDPSYGRVVSDYIHLNPARAGIVHREKPQLRNFPWSSYPAFCGGEKLPRWLRSADVLAWHHFDWRRNSGRSAYRRYLQKRAEEGWRLPSSGRPTTEDLKELRAGWALGSKAFRKHMGDLAAAAAAGKERQSYTGDELRTSDESTARRMLDRGLESIGMDLGALRLLRHNDPRKQAVAWLIRATTIVGDHWISQQLELGHRSNISRAVRAFRIAKLPEIRKLKRLLHVCTD